MFGVILCLIFRRGNRLRRSMPSGTTYVENDRLLATSSSRWRIDARGLTLLSQFHNKKAGPTSAQIRLPHIRRAVRRVGTSGLADEGRNAPTRSASFPPDQVARRDWRGRCRR